ncbi:MAG TPA: hypothetical protein ENK49_10545 [Gammaproteobacteria bacterium]|nr:hypothetical protein [Gammaproteobacteria bacterium]
MNRRTRCPVICISGIDGCGKTSIIEGVRRELEADGLPTRYVWLRYNHYLTKILLAFCRLVGLTRYEYPDGVRVGYHDFYRSRLVSWLFVVFTYIDTLFVSILLVYIPAWLGSRALVCDRYVLDIMIDLEVDTRIRFAAGSRLERLFRSLMPAGAQCYLVMRDQTAVLECRPENVRDGNFQRRWMLYEEYATRSWVELVENNSTIEQAVARVTSQTRAERSR